MKKLLQKVWNGYRVEVYFIVILLTSLLIDSKFFFPILLIGLFGKVVQKSNAILQRDENFETSPVEESLLKRAEFSIERKKFIIQYVVIPAFIGFLAYLITDRVYGNKETIIIGISNSSYSNSVDFSKIYYENYIKKANELLGGYHPSLQFDIVTISGNYEEIWKALDEERIDIAFVSPYNFQNKLGQDTMINGYEVIGGKYTGIGATYKSGFLVSKKHRQLIKKDSDIANKIGNHSLELLLSNEPLSTSGYVVPCYWLKDVKRINQFDVSSCDRQTLPENVELIIADSFQSNKIKACTFSSDMWNNMKSISPELSNKLHFVPIDTIEIQMDPVVVKKTNWDKKNTIWLKIVDLIKLRNTDIGTDRHEIIENSLRYIMNKEKNRATLFKESYKFKSIQ